jgi:hypothetical protein
MVHTAIVVFEVLTAALMMEAARTSETLVNFYGATTHKTAIFIQQLLVDARPKVHNF